MQPSTHPQDTRPEPTADERAKVAEAAKWLACAAPHERTKPAVPLLADRFGLRPVLAIAAIREANLLKATAH